MTKNDSELLLSTFINSFGRGKQQSGVAHDGHLSIGRSIFDTATRTRFHSILGAEDFEEQRTRCPLLCRQNEVSQLQSVFIDISMINQQKKKHRKIG